MSPASRPPRPGLAAFSVAPHLRVLRAVGFCRLPPHAPHARLHALYCGAALAATSFYVVQQAIYAYQERRDMAKLSRVLFVLLCHASCVAKQAVFHAGAPRVQRLIDGLDDAAYERPEPEARALLAGTARRAARLQRLYAACGAATCALWAVFPVARRLRGLRVEFPAWTFLDSDGSLGFALVLIHYFYVTNLVAIGNTTMDAFIATILDQCKTQLRILRMSFEDLPRRAQKLAADKSKEQFEAALSSLFRDCIQHFQKISDMMELVQQVFGLAVLVQFTVGGWILCMAAYKIVSVNVLSFEFASTTLFIVCILTELFLYCYYGNEVTVESSRVVSSLYAMDWVAAPLRFKRSLLLTMVRAHRPLRPAAGHVIPLSLDTFVTILKSSYSFYAMLRQTK